jgi:hypothetical protein
VDVVMADRQAEPLQKVRPALRFHCAFVRFERSVACWDAGSMTVPCVSCALFLCPTPCCMGAVPPPPPGRPATPVQPLVRLPGVWCDG